MNYWTIYQLPFLQVGLSSQSRKIHWNDYIHHKNVSQNMSKCENLFEMYQCFHFQDLNRPSISSLNLNFQFHSLLSLKESINQYFPSQFHENMMNCCTHLNSLSLSSSFSLESKKMNLEDLSIQLRRELYSHTLNYHYSQTEVQFSSLFSQVIQMNYCSHSINEFF